LALSLGVVVSAVTSVCMSSLLSRMTRPDKWKRKKMFMPNFSTTVIHIVP
jgi:hypothetical protein